jgi:hypothetical protein
MVLRDNRWYMFFEVLNGATKRGEIGLASSDDCLKWNYEQIVLREAFHLSYPSVFEWKHEYYMLPESHKASAVRLYKARSFPFEWELAGTLLQGEPFADASLYYNDLWWLFTEVSPGRTHDMLRLYYSKDLMGPWAQHPCSPVVEKTPYLARPAGRVVEFDGRIYRFAQVCSPEYGLRVNTLHVQELTPDKYAEELVEANPALGPSGTGWNQHGMHHVDAHRLNSGEWIACVDGWRAVQNSAYMKPLWRR